MDFIFFENVPVPFELPLRIAELPEKCMNVN